MAQRRMFSPQIIDSDAFLEMGTGAQALYFHLGMRADDDGFVGNPRKIMKIVGGNEDDIKILLVKRFILDCDDGIIVIKHWRLNNLIRKDWYKETVYIEAKKRLKIKENGIYSFTEGENLVNENAPTSAHRLGKDRIDIAPNGALSTPLEKETGEQTGRGGTKKPKKLGFPNIEVLEKSPQKHIKLIAYYFKKTNKAFENELECDKSANRWLRTAGDIAAFSDEKINQAFELAQEKYPEIWTLGTVYKILTK